MTTKFQPSGTSTEPRSRSVIEYFQVFQLHLWTGYHYIGRLARYKFCGNTLTMVAERSIEVHQVSDEGQPKVWRPLGSVLKDQEFVFELCMVDTQASSRKKLAYRSDKDVIEFSSDPELCAEVERLLQGE